MSITPLPNFNQSKSKLRTLWEVANRLVADYESFDKRLTDLENKINSVSSRVDSTIVGIQRNV
jgi:division protein CdvB (Snf7/Vps24/ESCRT-III family)